MEKEKKIEYRTQLIIPNECSFKDMYETYKFFCEAHKPIEIKVYMEVLTDFMKYIIQLVFLGHRVELPYRCGALCIMGYKPSIENIVEKKKHLNVDWGATNRLAPRPPRGIRLETPRVLICHTNEHSNGVIYKFFWKKNFSKIKNAVIYKFKLAKANRHALSETIKMGMDYMLIPPYKYKTTENINHLNPLDYNSVAYFYQ